MSPDPFLDAVRGVPHAADCNRNSGHPLLGPCCDRDTRIARGLEAGLRAAFYADRADNVTRVAVEAFTRAASE